jgi:hypothetical protein
MVNSRDAVKTGLVASRPQPDANVTGMTAIRVGGSSRVKTYDSVEYALFQILTDWHFYQ